MILKNFNNNERSIKNWILTEGPSQNICRTKSENTSILSVWLSWICLSASYPKNFSFISKEKMAIVGTCGVCIPDSSSQTLTNWGRFMDDQTHVVLFIPTWIPIMNMAIFGLCQILLSILYCFDQFRSSENRNSVFILTFNRLTDHK